MPHTQQLAGLLGGLLCAFLGRSLLAELLAQLRGSALRRFPAGALLCRLLACLLRCTLQLAHVIAWENLPPATVQKVEMRKGFLFFCVAQLAEAVESGAGLPEVVRADRLMHGKTSHVTHDARTLFAGLPQPCEVGRYHSLIAAPASLPAQLEVSARTAEGEIMGVRHRTLSIEGVQFHPESILTPDGPQLLDNFLEFSAGARGAASGAGHVESA